MIPDIGLMIGAYILTRMLRVLLEGHPKLQGVVRVFAALTILITLVACADLLLRGTTGLNVGDLR